MSQSNVAFAVIVSWFLVSIGQAQDLVETKIPQSKLGTVKRGSFDVSFSAKGEAESAEKVEVKCQTTATVLSIIPEGKKVKPGDWLATLSSSELENNLYALQIATGQAETEVVSAQTRNRLAVAAIKEYEDVIYVQQKAALEYKKFVAEQTSELQQQERTAAEEAGKKEWEMKRLDIQLWKSEGEMRLLDRQLNALKGVTRRAKVTELKGEVAASEVAVRKADEKFRILQKQLENNKQQIQACTIVAPDGFHGEVYFSRSMQAEGMPSIEAGTKVYQGQAIAYVPASNKMNVLVRLPQADAVRVESGMPAKIQFLDRTYKGYVISNEPKRSNPGSSDEGLGITGICTIRVIDPPDFVEGMSADVTIKVGEVRNKMYLPAEAVLTHAGRTYCCVQTAANSYGIRSLTTGSTNGRFVEVLEGIAVGDRFLNNRRDWPEHLQLPAAEPSLDADFNFQIPERAESSDGGSQPSNSGDRPSKPQGLDGKGGDRISQMFARYDGNKDGKIDKEELDSLDDRVKGFIGRTDGNGDGEITIEEMRQAMEKMMKQMNQRGGNPKK